MDACIGADDSFGAVYITADNRNFLAANTLSGAGDYVVYPQAVVYYAAQLLYLVQRVQERRCSYGQASEDGFTCVY